MNSHPTRFERIMLLTAFPPAPPTPTTVMRGLSSCSSFGMLRLIILSPSTPLAAVILLGPPAHSPLAPIAADRCEKRPGSGLRSPVEADRYYLFCRKQAPAATEPQSKLKNSRATTAPFAPISRYRRCASG